MRGSLFYEKVYSYFNLQQDKEDEAEIVESIKQNTDFKGVNLWALIFAILIASIGLNVNAPAAIIGAMLISPLMGPIMGIGLGVGTNDFELVKRGARNLMVASLIGIVTSFIYFSISPLRLAQSELLARTNPSLWDVFVAFFGGLAGIIAGTSRKKSNVIPGVAIATALMPPLCTAGFGMATGNLYYFLGAIYLYFINGVFICIATFLIIRLLKFHRKEFQDKTHERKVSRYILIIVVLTILPSIFLAYRIVDKSIFENNARKFVENELRFQKTQVLQKTFKYGNAENEIILLLIGEELSKEEIGYLKDKLPVYNLSKTALTIKHGINQEQVDVLEIKSSILHDLFERDSAFRAEEKKPGIDLKSKEIKSEINVLFPQITSYTISEAILQGKDTATTDSITQFTYYFSKKLRIPEENKLRNWLKIRLHKDSVQIVSVSTNN